MEALLHFAWEHRLYEMLTLVSDTDDASLEVIDPGVYNPHAGPDFFNAKIRLGDMLWVGSVELHHSAQEWHTHGHDTDDAYRGVVLHVVEVADAVSIDSLGRRIPTATMSIGSDLKARADYLVSHATQLACAPLDYRLPAGTIEPELERLARERIVAKAEAIYTLWTSLQDWYEVLYTMLMRHLGLGLNNDAMERLARSLPLRCLRKQIDHSEQVEALVLGQAGLLDMLPESDYRALLMREYSFLARKYELSPLSPSVWRLARTRPASFPTRRLLQLCALLRSDRLAVERWVEASTPEALDALFDLDASSPYWQGQQGLSVRLGRATRQILAINVAIPLRVAWARMQGWEEQAIEQALALQRLLPAEDNRYTRLFRSAGIEARHAADGQALAQRYKAYCIQRKCIHCLWGRQLLGSTPLEGERERSGTPGAMHRGA